jgi:hypothetical protein
VARSAGQTGDEDVTPTKSKGKQWIPGQARNDGNGKTKSKTKKKTTTTTIPAEEPAAPPTPAPTPPAVPVDDTPLVDDGDITDGNDALASTTLERLVSKTGAAWLTAASTGTFDTTELSTFLTTHHFQEVYSASGITLYALTRNNQILYLGTNAANELRFKIYAPNARPDYPQIVTALWNGS